MAKRGLKTNPGIRGAVIMAYNNGELVKNIAVDWDLDRGTVYNILREEGVPRRIRKPASADEKAAVIAFYKMGHPIKDIMNKFHPPMSWQLVYSILWKTNLVGRGSKSVSSNPKGVVNAPDGGS
jgi:hypothetical protein